MTWLDISSDQLAVIGYYKVMKKFLMFPYKGWHIRLDQKPIGKANVLSVQLQDSEGNPTGAYGYRISSFHIKRENNSSFISETKGEYFGKKIINEESGYVYFVYSGGGVWQPIWGYGKFEQKHKDEIVWKADSTEIDADMWGFSCRNARWFLRKMTKATGKEHELACGPIQGSQARLFTQL